MKNIILAVLISTLASPVCAGADTFLEAPLPPDVKTVLRTDERLEMKSAQSHDELLEFYKTALQDHKDIKIRDWKDSTYIEDDGAQPWHSITISKEGRGETEILIVKDSWTWTTRWWAGAGEKSR